MNRYPSRSEKREIQLYAAAEKGQFSLKDFPLYRSEIRRLEKQGFDIFINGTYEFSADMFLTTIDWSNSYHGSVPTMVANYINGIIKTYPHKKVTCFAHELYVIASKVDIEH